MEKSGFFNSSNGDRKYKADFFAEYFSSFIGNGVFPNPSTGLQIISNNNMTVTVKAGKAWINGYYYSNDSDLILTIAVADGVLNRIDRIVLQFNTVDRMITAKVKKGTFASTPVAQGLQRDADAYELGIADIAVNKGAVSISQANIIDLRLNSSLCGIVHGTVDQVDTTTLWNQYKAKFEETSEQFEADFQSWFTGIQGALSGDVAGNLLNQINDLAGAGRTTETVKGNADAITALDKKVTSHQADSLYQIAGGTGTAITLTISGSLVTGYPITFIASANNGGVATKINNKPLYKPGTTTAPKLIAGKAYTVWYNATGDCFFIKASAEGDVVPAYVLAGKTFSNDDDVGLVGTMPANPAYTVAPSFHTYGDGSLHFHIPVGAYLYDVYGNGRNDVMATDPNFIAANVVSGKSIFGLAGSATITSLGGKRVATGTATSGTTLQTFEDLNGGQYSQYVVSVTGLSFKPSLIYMFYRSGNDTGIVIYSESPSEIYPKTIKSVNTIPRQSSYSSTAQHFKGDTWTASVFSGGFKLPSLATGVTYTWIAYE